MKVRLSDILEGIEFQTDESRSYLRKSTGEIALFMNEEISAAEDDKDLSDRAEWYQEAVAKAKELLENQDDFLDLPSQYEFHEYRIMERFVLSLPVETQREELLDRIKGKGAFSRFKAGLDHFMLLGKWYQYRDRALREFAIRWCRENGLEIESERPRHLDGQQETEL